MVATARHMSLSAVLAAKRDLLHELARDFARGQATTTDLEEAAVEFTAALEAKAQENIRGMRR